MSAARKTRGASFRILSREESERVLMRNHVGRIAYSFHDRVNIEPVHYVFDEGWLYGRTSHGEKLTIIEHHPWVAFEVDEVRDVFDWRSVVVKGAFYVVGAVGDERDEVAFTRGVALMRALVPDVLTANDPTPFRQSVFRIHLDEVTGRESQLAGR
jgi:nitroimidazol reductase NimA-like FMN-containing flavoprotein (pyridoxamine 5'-phosphate oxidase superfamily)